MKEILYRLLVAAALTIATLIVSSLAHAQQPTIEYEPSVIREKMDMRANTTHISAVTA